MVTNFDLSELNMTDIEDYFTYIFESRINGQHTQAKAMYAEMDQDQKVRFYNHIQDYHGMSAEYILGMRNYFEPIINKQ